MSAHWSTHQLTEYMFSVSRPQDAQAAMAVALEYAVEAVDAEVGVVIEGGTILAQVGFGARGVPTAFLQALTQATEVVDLVGVGPVHLARADLDKSGSWHAGGRDRGRLVAGRLSEAYAAEEVQMLQGMAFVLGLVLHNLDTLQAERSRHRLVETLLSIQRAVSARRPLKEVLDAVTEGASSLLGACPVALLLTDPGAGGALMPASVFDFPDLDAATLAVVEQVMAGGSARAQPAPGTGADQVMAEPVIVEGEIAGCLATRVNWSHPRAKEHGELLAAFAQQVSLALTDAQTLDAVREAHRDPITGLPNRALFLKQAERASRIATGHGKELTVLFIDLDRFKAVNDTLGHPAGDALLAEVARRIEACIRPCDLAARLGGDEFAVLLDDAGVELGRTVAERIITSLARAFVITGREVSIGASVGITQPTAAQRGAADLLSDADVAMYCAKRSGRGRAVVFEPSMHDDVATSLALRTDLARAHDSGQLWLAYQPIVDIGTGGVCAAEALMRWTHPERGAIPPSDFIPIAEETQMIIQLGAWALRQALTDAVPWRIRCPELSLSVNLSARQIADPRLPLAVASALELSGFPAEALTLEVTESILMEDPELARGRLVALKDLGLSLAIDDFGTGYSSLAYLRQFPMDVVKIDRSFIKGLAINSPDDIAVVRSVLSLCRSLRLRTVAEGIEQPDQWAILADLGCDRGQGYLFARPMPAQQWAEYAETAAPGRPPSLPTPRQSVPANRA
jgi:diguanylate cyclase (GGDEF)-like protein